MDLKRRVRLGIDIMSYVRSIMPQGHVVDLARSASP